MKKLSILLATAATFAIAAPAATLAQGIAVDTPVGGVRIGEPYRHHYSRDWDGPRRHHWRDRDVYLRSGGCRTVTIQRDDGSVKQIRRCD